MSSPLLSRLWHRKVLKNYTGFLLLLLWCSFPSIWYIYTNLIFHLLTRAPLSDPTLKSHSGQDWLNGLNNFTAQFCWEITVHSCFPFSLLISWAPNTCIKWDFKSAPIWPQVSVSSLQTYMSPILSLHPFDQAASLSRAILPFIGSLTWLIPPSWSHTGAERCT